VIGSHCACLSSRPFVPVGKMPGMVAKLIVLWMILKVIGPWIVLVWAVWLLVPKMIRLIMENGARR